MFKHWKAPFKHLWALSRCFYCIFFITIINLEKLLQCTLPLLQIKLLLSCCYCLLQKQFWNFTRNDNSVEYSSFWLAQIRHNMLLVRPSYAWLLVSWYWDHVGWRFTAALLPRIPGHTAMAPPVGFKLLQTTDSSCMPLTTWTRQ